MRVISSVFYFLGMLSLMSLFALCTSAEKQVEEVKYGHEEQTYSLPDVSGTIYYVSPNGNENADGIKLDTPPTIENAFAKVTTGDAIVMRGGIYRAGDLILL